MKCSRTISRHKCQTSAAKYVELASPTGIRAHEEGWDCPFTSTWHRAHPSLALGAKLLSIVDIVAWDFWVVKLFPDKTRPSSTHSSYTYGMRVEEETA